MAQKLAHEEVSKDLRSSRSVSLAGGAETKKAQDIQGFDAICLLLASLGETLRIGEEGLENPTNSKEKATLSEELSTKLSTFDMGSLWKTLRDSDQRKLFASVIAMVRGSNGIKLPLKDL